MTRKTCSNFAHVGGSQVIEKLQSWDSLSNYIELYTSESMIARAVFMVEIQLTMAEFRQTAGILQKANSTNSAIVESNKSHGLRNARD